MLCRNPRYLFVIADDGEKKTTLITTTDVEKISYASVKDGRKDLTGHGHFENKDYYYDRYATIRCGKCEACRQKAAKDWAIRAAMETETRGEPCFITLTYDPEHVPDQLTKKHVQDFLKRLRHETNEHISYMAAGEYGEHTHRPHYHLLIWGWKPKQTRIYAQKQSYILYQSEDLKRLWPYGFSLVSFGGTAAAAKYTAKYLRKGGGFLLTSRRPALGRQYLIDHPKEHYALAGFNHVVNTPRYGIK